jgi:hypothetical protein
MAARVGRVTFLRALVGEEEAPRGECDECRTCWKAGCWRVGRCAFDVIAVAQVRNAGIKVVVVRVFVGIAVVVALARARDMFAPFMFAEATEGGLNVDCSKGGTLLRLERT